MKYKLLHFLILGSMIVSCSPLNVTNISPTAQTVTETIPVIPTATRAPQVTKTFSLIDEEIQNPERGFTTDASLNDTNFSEYYDDGYTLVYANIQLDEYRNVDLPDEFLGELSAWFSLIRGSGVKVIIRFLYNDGPYPNPEPDAKLDQILRHQQQLGPLLQKNSDVIAWLEAGFIGAWGEWHSSTNGLDKNIDAKKKVLFSLLDVLPSDRMVLLRYPVDIMTIFPTPISRENAFSGEDQSRVGFHNDCFLSSYDDQHTYARGGVFTREQEFNYLTQMTMFVPVGGESCEYNPPRSDCATALQEASLLHFSELNDGWYPDVLSAWEEQGCYNDFQQRLGYRFSINSVTYDEIVAPGGILRINAFITNDGFASLVNPRPIFVVLDGPVRYQVELPDDPRFWAPGKVSEVSVRLRIPANAPLGNYKLSIWMPDAYESLREDPRYSVRFANDNIWDGKNGLNVLASTSVDSTVGGNIDASAGSLEVIP